MRRIVAIVAGVIAIGCMVASNVNSSDSNARLHSLGDAGISLGRAEHALDQLPENAPERERAVMGTQHMKALDAYKAAFLSASMRIGGAELLGRVSLIFLAVAVCVAVWK
ncbi:hypothetical protein OKA04_00930 [Luteolibacter flavescens]|uniref:Lipoprotein n=1 Tax=Luteolibacter flavescens TaxID=1859460 RepID=A0ABT3FI73_9BACT|nr:hypothetical protein [Luteolibacter flavescens]MCW1883271.1 hypothetical protein [Luteolibacter flavescens]